MEINQVIPNFYCSIPYLKAIGATIWCNKFLGTLWVEHNDEVLFPPICVTTNRTKGLFKDFIWSDFSNTVVMEALYDKTFLDYEYIFDPVEFDNMAGGHWETFRKNSRKWKVRHVGQYTDLSFIPDINKKIGDLLIEWFDDKNNIVDDPEVIAHFAMSYNPYVYRKGIISIDGELIALNVADYNYHYVNYRLCLCKKNQPYLPEYARLLFYKDPLIRIHNKLVNDGGCLGSAGLEKFKDKMNPIMKRKVHSWKRRKV